MNLEPSSSPSQGTSMNDGAKQAPVLSVKDWIITLIVLAIPLVNLIMLFVWAFGDQTNPNKKNYARASLILTAIFIVLYILLIIFMFTVFGLSGLSSHSSFK